MTDKEIKIMIVYDDDASGLSMEDKFKYEAYLALWNNIISVFINDEDLTPINPANQ